MKAPPRLPRSEFLLNRHLQHAWGRAKSERLDPYLAVERERTVMSLAVSFDPSPSGKFLDWICRWRRRQWDQWGFPGSVGMEELRELGRGLAHFHSIRDRLPSDQRDIGRYGSVEELLRTDPDTSIRNGAGDERRDRFRAYEECVVHFMDKPWILVQPKTVEASAWWGRGTRWCTAARSNSLFGQYDRRGGLLVMSTPTGKYQLAPASREFRDACDRGANLHALLRDAPPGFREIVLRQLAEFGTG